MEPVSAPVYDQPGIVKETGIPAPALHRYLSEPDVRALLSPQKHRGRTVYPASSLPLFHLIARLHYIGAMTQKSAAAQLDVYLSMGAVESLLRALPPVPGAEGEPDCCTPIARDNCTDDCTDAIAPGVQYQFRCKGGERFAYAMSAEDLEYLRFRAQRRARP